jgi:hypothetical protein
MHFDLLVPKGSCISFSPLDPQLGQISCQFLPPGGSLGSGYFIFYFFLLVKIDKFAVNLRRESEMAWVEK